MRGAHQLTYGTGVTIVHVREPRFEPRTREQYGGDQRNDAPGAERP